MPRCTVYELLKDMIFFYTMSIADKNDYFNRNVPCSYFTLPIYSLTLCNSYCTQLLHDLHMILVATFRLIYVNQLSNCEINAAKKQEWTNERNRVWAVGTPSHKIHRLQIVGAEQLMYYIVDLARPYFVTAVGSNKLCLNVAIIYTYFYFATSYLIDKCYTLTVKR